MQLKNLVHTAWQHKNNFGETHCRKKANSELFSKTANNKLQSPMDLCILVTLTWLKFAWVYSKLHRGSYCYKILPSASKNSLSTSTKLFLLFHTVKPAQWWKCNHLWAWCISSYTCTCGTLESVTTMYMPIASLSTVHVNKPHFKSNLVW